MDVLIAFAMAMMLDELLATLSITVAACAALLFAAMAHDFIKSILG